MFTKEFRGKAFHMPHNLCVSGYIGCGSNVLHVMDGACSGRKECQYDVVPNADLEELTSCSQAMKMYLDSSYECVRGKVDNVE